MFDDPKKELERLQRELLADEESEEELDLDEILADVALDEELDEVKKLIGPDPAAKRRTSAPAPRPAYRAAPLPEDEELPDEVDDRVGFLKVLAWLLAIGILALGGYWAWMLL